MMFEIALQCLDTGAGVPLYLVGNVVVTRAFNIPRNDVLNRLFTPLNLQPCHTVDQAP